VAKGRRDQPYQINNVLAFPGIFRGLLDGAADLTVAAHCAAAHAIADAVSKDELDAEHIVPDVFDEDLVPAVARAVMNA
jgi:malate dehydrogenase (oxaloacetate-decarboxylating)